MCYQERAVVKRRGFEIANFNMNWVNAIPLVGVLSKRNEIASVVLGCGIFVTARIRFRSAPVWFSVANEGALVRRFCCTSSFLGKRLLRRLSIFLHFLHK